ncbi:MAG: hypothetical protein ACE5GT_01560 [Rhodospirillales bacterium]
MRLVLGAVVAAMALGPAAPAFAHAFGQRYDLPVPLGLYLFGAGAAVVVSFVVIGVFLRDFRWSRAYPRLDLLRHPLGRFAAHRHLVNALRAAAVLLFVLVIMAGFLGHQHPMRNVTPVLVWIIWWVGMAYVSAFVGDLWAVINPWRTVFQWAEALYRRLAGGELSRRRPYPEVLGAWPAVGLLLAFAWVELVFPEPAVPANIAIIVVVYSVLTWAGMFLYGREKWLRRGEAFSLLFGILARFAPTEVRVSKPAICDACGLGCLDGDGQCVNCATCFDQAGDADREWALRPFAVGLLRNESVPASVMAFVLLVLSIVLYDGLLATPGWARFEDLALAALAAPGDVPRLGFRTFGLVGFWLLFLGAYLATCRIMAAIAGGRLSTLAMANRFVFTLVPIAIAYHLAHYLSYLLIQGQYALPLASDPFGFGWDLFGTAGYKVDIAVVGARFAWYLAVAAIVTGHVIAVYLAHVVAMTTLEDRRRALGSQYPMTALMVAFTITSLSILAEPIVQRPPSGAETAAAAPAAMPVPEDAVLPEPGSGLFKPVGPGRFARVGLRYGAMASLFHDGTRVTPADILYPYAFAFRWGVRDAEEQARYDPEIDRSTALLRRRLAGVRVMGVDKSSKSIRVGDFAFVREMVIVEVYVTDSPAPPETAAAVAPPWSSVPWHVLALMEEAVARGWAAFSEAGAARSGAPWLDLARSPQLNEKLAALVAEFAGRGFVPEPIKHLVSDEKARKRWAALKAFFEEHGHFLVTNGPYRLKSWSADATVLEVFRDISYPLGVGSYDAYAVPRRAHIVAVEPVDGGLSLSVEVERVEKFMRSFRIVREPLTGAGVDVLKGQKLVSRYVVVGDDGRVRLAGRGRLAEDGRIVFDLAGRLQPGDYTVLAALYLNGNTFGPDIRRIPYRAR